MAVSMRDLDPAFQGAGQKAGLEIWRIENFNPVPVPKASYGKFFTGDSYIILKTTSLKSGTLRHDIHYWLGRDTTQDEAGTAAIKTIELDAALGGRAVQYREVQGHETEKFLSCFKPCIIPQEGGFASGFKHAEAEEHKTRLFVCKGKRVVHVKEVPFSRSSLNHDDIFILDTKSKIFQFNGSNSSIQERAKALEVVQYVKDTYHNGKCEMAAIEDGKLMADPETGEFWGFFGGFAPLPRKTTSDEDKHVDSHPTKLFRIEKGELEPLDADSLTRDLLETQKCYILDSGFDVFAWMGRNTSLDDRKKATAAAEKLVHGPERPRSQITSVIEGFETATFRSKFDSWPQVTNVVVSEDGRGKVAALLKRQGINVKGLLKADPIKEEPQPYIDCTGNLQVWRVSGNEKILIPTSDQSKFYSGDCYIFQYSYPGDDKDEYLIGTWFGKRSVEEERATALSLVNKMVESLKFLPVQARLYEGNEPIQFYSIFQSFVVFKGGLSKGYKNYVAEKEIQDETYQEDGIALFRVQGSGPENMQAIQVDPVASSLNSSYCYILNSSSSVFTWSGSLTNSDNQELVERLLDLIKQPNVQSRPQKEGTESEQFWNLLGGKSEYPSQKVSREAESDPHLFSCTFSGGNLKVVEVYNFDQDDLMTEDIHILDNHSETYVWIGQQVDSKSRLHALTIGEKFLKHDFLLENLSSEAPVYIITEGSEPPFFTRFFKWDSAKSLMHGNSFQRKLTIVKSGGTPAQDKPKRRTPVSYGGRSAVPDKSQRSRSMSFSPERVRVRGRSPAFNALAATFENPNTRNLSTPPPVRKIYPKSVSPDSAKLAAAKSTIAALGASFEQPPPAREAIIPHSIKEPPKPKLETNNNGEVNDKEKQNSKTVGIETLTIQEDVKEGEAEDDEGLAIYPYDRLKTTSTDPISDIDVTRRETYLSSEEFRAKFGMTKEAFYKLPKWKQNKHKMALQLF
ncbi:villin-4-like isoform X1 [Cucurbita maxima]|uniref:Villin-4-like isoform X1 n=1 Tax=Cucurbita maxima TaxID=3661 RepID=A0A6J1K5Q4_CUCMA|nr:villin-4-like isoform X1 [Cucurbita maxima]XP_022997657.1 villin-4-like isoform X1 [Cucurbita maxima]XP_022997658.1 villin-4-like isoform X1 [Cucurbita maxima]